jgi:hypothetical protein
MSNDHRTPVPSNGSRPRYASMPMGGASDSAPPTEHRHRSRAQCTRVLSGASREVSSIRHRAWGRDGPPGGKRPGRPAAGVAVGSCRDTLAQTGADVRTLTSNLTRLIINHLRWHHLSPQGRHVCRNACRIRGSPSAHARAPAHDTAGSSVSYLVKDAIRRHQTPSDAIRRHQTPSDAIRRNRLAPRGRTRWDFG